MKIFIAKTAGFCFGVDRALSLIDSLLNKGEFVCTLGDIIHNKLVVDNLKNRGVLIVENISDVPHNSTLVIRSHGVPKNIIEKIKSYNLNYIDATCPFVKKIHNIVEEASLKGKIVFIAGDSSHPEVEGICGYCEGKYYVFKDIKELKKIINDEPFNENDDVIVVAQTTYNKNQWDDCVKLIQDKFKNLHIFETICSATRLRQKEAEKLSKAMDVVLVVGGKHSSNTNKLYSICSKNCDTYFIESLDDIPYNKIKSVENIGITAGASTPQFIINKVKESLEINI